MRKEDLPPKYQKQVEQKLGVQTAKKTVKTNKYNAVKETVGKLKFDSKKEATRYCELKQLEMAGVIKGLRLQPRYTLQEKYEINGRKERAITYIADFEYYDNEKQKIIVEDVKSPATKTQVYRIKKKLFEKRYNIEVTEI